jgi:hypothetical protein
VLKLFKFVAQGLAFTHWGVLMPEAYVHLFSGFLIPEGAGYMEAMLNTTNCIPTGQVSLGDGVFTYKVVRDRGHESVTAWRMSMYGVLTEADFNGQRIRILKAYLMTAPRGLKTVTDLMRAWNRPATA